MVFDLTFNEIKKAQVHMNKDEWDNVTQRQKE